MTTHQKIIEIMEKVDKLYSTKRYELPHKRQEIAAKMIAPMIDKRDAIIDYLLATFDIDINNDPEICQRINQLKTN